MVSRRFDEKPEEKGTTPKEQRARISLRYLVDLKCGVLNEQPIDGNHRLIFKWLFYCHQNLGLQQIKGLFRF